ncbi:MAG: hypothetical protein DWQ10_13265 [Calditrichaeota bacterium]|nr:MAG: hypothetical protein DWQ10_13265 [Calditrichota bacterium]
MSSKENAQDSNQRNLILGVVLIGVGLIFLFNNYFDFYLDNWWALFILIPAFIAFNEAWKLYKQNGQIFTREVKNRIIGGIFPLVVALVFLLNIDWGTIWPIFIIIIGIFMLFN